MNNESDIWNCESYLGSMDNTPNDTNPVFPQFGPYNPTFSANATLQCTSTRQPRRHVQRDPVGAGVPGHGQRFLPEQLRRRASAAFTPAARPCAMSPRRATTTSRPAAPACSPGATPSIPTPPFFPGYSNFKGYTQGPGYWGKTFFIWPPQPTSDWRKLYFEPHQRHAAERQHPVVE